MVQKQHTWSYQESFWPLIPTVSAFTQQSFCVLLYQNKKPPNVLDVLKYLSSWLFKSLSFPPSLVLFPFLRPECLYISIYNYTHVLRDMYDIGHPEGVFSSPGISVLQRKKKTHMDGGRKQVVKGNSETHCAKIVILRASSKVHSQIMYCSQTASHRNMFGCVSSLFWYTKSILSWGWESKVKEVFLTWNCLISCFKGQSSFCDTKLVEEWESI